MNAIRGVRDGTESVLFAHLSRGAEGESLALPR